jgi:hypothetical protein
MKLRFDALALIGLFTSLSVIVYYMQDAGVPSAIILSFSFIYGMCFPWRIVSMEPEQQSNNEESLNGESKNEDDKPVD